MARTAKFSDDLLLEAVVKYSEIVRTKIKATELAQWAKINIIGLEDVKDYHFTRPIKDPTTGKLVKKLCTQRIDELNRARDIKQRENTNVLLSSINMDRFFDMDARSQRKTIQEAREIVSEYKRSNIYLRKQNDYYKSLTEETNKRIEQYEVYVKQIMKRQNDLDKKVNDIRRNINDERIKLQLEEMGVIDFDFDLVRYNESLKESEKDIFNIEETIKQYQKQLNQDTDEADDQDDEEKKTDIQTKGNMIDDLLDF